MAIAVCQAPSAATSAKTRSGFMPTRLEHAELADALEHRHHHGVQDDDADRDVDDEESMSTIEPRWVSRIVAMTGMSSRQSATFSRGASPATCARGGRQVDAGGPAHDDLVRAVGDDEQLAPRPAFMKTPPRSMASPMPQSTPRTWYSSLAMLPSAALVSNEDLAARAEGRASWPAAGR